jgi:phenylpyruvate tautomerase PptA (4-oxalocrotonate tautomerase family)
VAEAKAARGQTTINQKAAAIASLTVVVVAAAAVAAATVTVAMAAAVQQPWQRRWRRQQRQMRGPMWGGGHLLYYCHNCIVQYDYNCQACCEYTLYVLAKHLMFSQNIKCFGKT